MKYYKLLNYLILGVFLSTLFSCHVEKKNSYKCPECPKCDEIKSNKKSKRLPKRKKTCKPKVIYKKLDKPIIGGVENVYLPKYKVKYTARIDTGAKTSSMHALNIVEFERDGKRWVKFDIPLSQKSERLLNIEKPLVRIVRIKDNQHESIKDRRYVIKMRYNISSISYFGEINLTDRNNFEHPILIGRNFIKGNAIVDVSKTFTKKPTTEEK